MKTAPTARSPKKKIASKKPGVVQPTLDDVRARMLEEADADDARFLQRFFKTGPGQYGEGDQFLGIRVPVTRKLAREFKHLSAPNIWRLLKSPWHEERLLALVLIVELHARSDAAAQKKIGDAYLKHARHINNWDLVDSSAEHVVGPMIADRGVPWLRRLAKSDMLWERRIAMLATFYEIKASEFKAALRIAEDLLGDKEDLIHKAVGWMLREIGKRNRSVEQAFLVKHLGRMPRTTLRYAIEHFPQAERQRFMNATETETATLSEPSSSVKLVRQKRRA